MKYYEHLITVQCPTRIPHSKIAPQCVTHVTHGKVREDSVDSAHLLRLRRPDLLRRPKLMQYRQDMARDGKRSLDSSTFHIVSYRIHKDGSCKFVLQRQGRQGLDCFGDCKLLSLYMIVVSFLLYIYIVIKGKYTCLICIAWQFAHSAEQLEAQRAAEAQEEASERLCPASVVGAQSHTIEHNRAQCGFPIFS